MFNLTFYKKKKKQPTNPLRSIKMSNAYPSCITETSGTGIGQDFLSKYCHYHVLI